QELRLVFQPIVQLETGSVHAFEALLRWHRPEQGVVLPPEFVPLAEQTGLILPIGAWVLHEACRYARRWQDALPASAPVRVSVNLSAKQLGHPGIVDEVRTAFQDAGPAPSSPNRGRRTAAPPDEIAPRRTGSGPSDEGREHPRQPPGGVRVPAEKQVWLDQLQLHEHQAAVPLHPIYARVQRMARQRRD